MNEIYKVVRRSIYCMILENVECAGTNSHYLEGMNGHGTHIIVNGSMS